MPTLVSVLQEEIYDAVGGREDAMVQVASLRGINLGQLLVAALYDVPELKATLDIIIAAGSSGFATSQLPSLLSLNSMYNLTTSQEVAIFQDLSRMRVVVPSTGTSIKAACRQGNIIYLMPRQASAGCTLSVYYTTFPTRVTASNSRLAFSNYDDLILLIATNYCWLVMEETENVDMVNKTIDKVSPTLLLTTDAGSLARARRMISGNNL